jgi:hypothetical protein
MSGQAEINADKDAGWNSDGYNEEKLKLKKLGVGEGHSAKAASSGLVHIAKVLAGQPTLHNAILHTPFTPSLIETTEFNQNP